MHQACLQVLLLTFEALRADGLSYLLKRRSSALICLFASDNIADLSFEKKCIVPHIVG